MSQYINPQEARTEQMCKEVTNTLKKTEHKLFKIRVRMKNLIGDCI